MKILTFSTLFPNHTQPSYAIFIKNRMMAVHKYKDVELKVVAPVPFFPPLKIKPRWYRFSQIKPFEILDGIEIYHPRYLVTPKIGMSLYGLNMFLGSLETVKAIYQRFPFDLIDAHYIYPDGFAAILLGKFFHKPVVLSARGTDINVYPKFKIIRNIMKYSLQRSSAIISVSSSLRDIMVNELEGSAEKIHVIPNGIEPNIFYCADKTDAKRKLGFSDRKRMVISVGSLIELKGHHILMDAIDLLRKNEQLNFYTYIIGEGEYREVLENKIKRLGLEKDVTLIGQIPNDELTEWYNAADIFFLGSSREGWPNVVSEALACGTPVVATKVNGIPEIMVSEDYGVLVERNAENFACGIRKALSKKWDCEKIYEYGQSRTWKTVASEVCKVFKNVIDLEK